MKIIAVRVIVTCLDRNYVFVKVVTDEDGLAVAKAIEHASELLIGRDPLDTEDLWQLLYHWSYWRGGPVLMAAVGAIDLALWDIKGKVAGRPVYQLLGGRSRLGAACYGHAHGEEPAEVEDSVRSFLERGYRHVRAQLGDVVVHPHDLERQFRTPLPAGESRRWYRADRFPRAGSARRGNW